MEDLIEETIELKKTGFNLGTKPVEEGKSVYTNLSRAEVIEAGRKRRREMK